MASKHDDKTSGTDILGLRETTPDRPATVRHDVNKHEGVGEAGEVERVSATGTFRQTKGATGIDMGAGGEGTDIER